MSPETKLLIAIYAEEVFRGDTLRQEKPACCGKEIDLFGTQVRFKDILVGRKKIVLMEPQCPACGRWVQPEYNLLQ